ncbi:hypothetical protein [Pedobacter heparinus]|nr:hypothetical protein [Pedobacter heparinus]
MKAEAEQEVKQESKIKKEQAKLWVYIGITVIIVGFYLVRLFTIK